MDIVTHLTHSSLRNEEFIVINHAGVYIKERVGNGWCCDVRRLSIVNTGGYIKESEGNDLC